MRSETKSPKDFFHAMKKKPALQAILDNLENYTKEELDNIHGQPLWIRKVLVELKEEQLNPPPNDEELNARAEAIADAMMAATPQNQEPIKFDVFEYSGNDFLLPCGRTGSMTLEVHAGNYFYIIDCDHNMEKYIIGIDSTIGYLKREQWFYFLNNSIFCGKMTKPEYSAFVSQNLGRNFKDRDEIARTAGPNSYVDPNSQQSFTIIRHPTTK